MISRHGIMGPVAAAALARQQSPLCRQRLPLPTGTVLAGGASVGPTPYGLVAGRRCPYDRVGQATPCRWCFCLQSTARLRAAAPAGGRPLQGAWPQPATPLQGGLGYSRPGHGCPALHGAWPWLASPPWGVGHGWSPHLLAAFSKGCPNPIFYHERVE
ncbi:hypothetical protein GW17_00014954 [Ensete ventricosum]|nr:hypothetical protein GW17_00014954 [Ensete ventricosum]RZS13843.1 hypothetical protein BHM03_00045469 [Ensete ventricosum]